MAPAQARALRAYRDRLAEKGLARFEVLGRPADRELIRDLARRLAKADAEADRLREELGRGLASPPARKGDILAALMRAPPEVVDLDFPRERDEGRDIQL